MKPKKQRGNEPSIKEKLSAAFVNDFLADYEAEGINAIRALRLKSPEKYCEIATRLIAASEPPSEGFLDCKDMRELGLRLLTKSGADESMVTENMIDEALEANDAFVDRLHAIAAQGQLQ